MTQTSEKQLKLNEIKSKHGEMLKAIELLNKAKTENIYIDFIIFNNNLKNQIVRAFLKDLSTLVGYPINPPNYYTTVLNDDLALREDFLNNIEEKPAPRFYKSFAEIQKANRESGGAWFKNQNEGKKIESKILYGRFFIESSHDYEGNKKFLIWEVNNIGGINPIGSGAVISHKTLAAAEAHLNFCQELKQAK
jgi:hypothetical protein